MHIHIKVAFLTVLFVMVASCHGEDAMCRRVVAQKFDNIDNARSDAERAYSLHHFELLAIRSYTLMVPGVPAAIAQRYRIQVIEGTTDAVCNTRQEKFQINEIKYASTYNEKMVNLTNGMITTIK